MKTHDHYLKKEFDQLIKEDPLIMDFLEAGSMDGTWYWDLEKPEHEWMSERFWRLFGYERHEKQHLASEWQDMVNQEDLKVALENFKKHLDDPEHPYDQIVRYTHKKGHTIWVRCRGIAIRNANGTPIRMLGAHTDLTPLKQAEDALRRKTEELKEANRQLHEALQRIETLRGLIPICTHCKSIRDDQGFWQDVETYVEGHSHAEFSHSLCPSCLEEKYPELAKQVEANLKAKEECQCHKDDLIETTIKAPNWTI